MTTFPLPAIAVDPQGQTVSIAFTGSPTVYVDPQGVTVRAMPATITAPTTFYLPSAGSWTVTPTVAGIALTATTVVLEDNQTASVTVPVQDPGDVVTATGQTGAPTTAGVAGEAFVDSVGVLWVYNAATGWQSAGAGVELGIAETTASYTLTATPTVIPGLSVPVNVPAGLSILVECECPWILMGGTQGVVTLTLFEDTTQIKGELRTYVANASGPMNVDIEYQPATVGAHTYTVQASATQTGTVEAGTVSGSIVTPHLRVVTA